MNIRTLALIASALSSLTLPACAATAEQPPTLSQRLEERGYRQAEAVERIQDYRIDGWNYLDREHIVLHAGPGRDYLIGLMTACHGLSSTESIAFSTTVGDLTRFDKLIVHDVATGREQCPIKDIHKLERVEKRQ